MIGKIYVFHGLFVLDFLSVLPFVIDIVGLTNVIEDDIYRTTVE